MQFLRNMVFPGGYMPHGSCYLWAPSLIGLHVASDSLIALSYLSIAVTLLVHFNYKRRDIPTLALYWFLLNQPPQRRAMLENTEKPA